MSLIDVIKVSEDTSVAVEVVEYPLLEDSSTGLIALSGDEIEGLNDFEVSTLIASKLKGDKYNSYCVSSELYGNIPYEGGSVFSYELNTWENELDFANLM
jgi:hypothetical protein